MPWSRTEKGTKGLPARVNRTRLGQTDKLDAGWRPLTITLNGDRFEIVRPLTVTDLPGHLDIN